MASSQFGSLPAPVRAEATRAFLNWMGCVLGGCREPAVMLAASMVAELGGNPQASVIGHGFRTDMAGAALVNCTSSSNLAYDDTHLATVTHPTGPVAAALFALSETRPASGEDFLNALALGIEVTCRLSNVLLLPPAKFNVGLYVTGLTAQIGAAAAAGKLLGLDEPALRRAIGIGASQFSGFRAVHGSMTSHLVPGNAARAGVWAALLAAKGFTCPESALEADKGLVDVLSVGADLGHAVAGLGEEFELLSNAYKPYPCGIVIHPAIDACLEIREKLGQRAAVGKVALIVHPLALSLTDRRRPTTPLETNVSLYHWAAAALLRGRAGILERRQDCIDDPEISTLREAMQAVADPGLQPDEAIVEVTTDGVSLRSHVAHARGSIARPMTDQDLDAKFRSQANTVLPPTRTEELLVRLRRTAELPDVGRDVSEILKHAHR